MSKVRARFAPSPTGYLHIGGLRSALFGYLTAKSQDGVFLLRIEDTDQKREVEGAADKLLEILKWSGINFDEGAGISGDFGPYIQSERRDIYLSYAKELIEKDSAYYCFCSPERLDKMRTEQQAKKEPPRYDRCCRDLDMEIVKQKISNGEPYVIRQKIPLDSEISVVDELRGEIKFKTNELEDNVLIKTNGMATYQLANVVDDHLMEITHVTRGEEWIPSFPKNILLYQAFGWQAPKFIHLPVVLNKDGGGKLSKRQGDVSVESYREKGYLPEAIINFCALQGWHPKDDNEIFSLEDIIPTFSFKDINASPAIFDVERLDYLNGYYIRQMSLEALTEKCLPFLKENIELSTIKKQKTIEYVSQVISLVQERLKKLSEVGEFTKFFFCEELDFPAEFLIWKKLTLEEAKNNLKQIEVLLSDISNEDWNKNLLEEKIITFLKDNNLKVGDFLWPMRVALTGQKASPGPFEVAGVLGKDACLNRLQKAISM